MTGKSDDQRWAATRAGARAGRGFRYQDAVAATLLIEQWSHGASAEIVPEGLDDLSLILRATETRVQVKSMHDPKGAFRIADLAEFLDKSASLLTDQEWIETRVMLAVVLERPVDKLLANGWLTPLSLCEGVEPLRQALVARLQSKKAYSADQVLERAFLVVESAPIERAVGLLAEKKGVPAAVCRLAVQNLRVQVGLCADENYLRQSSNPSTVSTADLLMMVDRVLLATHEGGLDRPVKDGLCEVVDFLSEVRDGAFYSGVNVVAGHVAAGLVFDRPQVTNEIDRTVNAGRSVLIAGPSGSGKSACAWLYAYATRHEVIWYRVSKLREGDAHLLLRLAIANEASRDRKIGFILDDVGRNFAGSWDELVRGASQHDGVVVVGTVREEDLDLISDLRSSVIVRPRLDEELANRLFSQLVHSQSVQFDHWREPFEQSRGLLLEFTHLITQGERLESVLRDQVRRRVVEHRDDELLILQAVSFGSRFAASLNKERLRITTSLDSFSFARALGRLLEEHAVSLIGDDSVGGLHEIRSRYLDALVREIAHASESSSMRLVISSIRFDDLARFISLVHQEMPELQSEVTTSLRNLLSQSPLAAWTAAYHGLGLITCDAVGERWMAVCKDEGIDERFASLIFSFVIANTTLEGFESWEKVRGAFERYSEINVHDMRSDLSMQLVGLSPSSGWSLKEASEFAAALMPLHGAVDPPDVPGWLVSTIVDDPSVLNVLNYCSILREVSERVAASAIEVRGGAALILRLLHEQSAWLTMPTLEADGEDWVIRANIRFISDEVQPQLRERAVSMCELLMAASPQASVAACSAVLGDGTVLKIAEFPVADLRIERERIVVAARVAWNRSQLRSIQNVQEVASDTARANSLAIALRETTSNLQEVAEYFCRLSRIPARLQAFTSIRPVLTGMIPPAKVESFVSGVLDKGSYDTSDVVLDLVEGIQEITKELVSGTVDKPLLKAATAIKMSRKMHEAARSRLWNYTEHASGIEFDSAAVLLEQISYVLADMHAYPAASYSSRAELSKRSRKHSALKLASRQSLDRAAGLVEKRRIELLAQCDEVRPGCVVVARHESFERSWPAVSFCLVIPCDGYADFVTFIGSFVEKFSWNGQENRVVVPLLRGKVAGRLALGGLSTLLPLSQFSEEWRDLVDYPFLDNVATSVFDRILDRCTCISAVVTGLDRELNAEECEVLERLIKSLSEYLNEFTELGTDEGEVIQAASLFISEWVESVRNQIASNGAGPSLAQDAAALFRGEVSELNERRIGYRVLLSDWDAAKEA